MNKKTFVTVSQGNIGKHIVSLLKEKNAVFASGINSTTTKDNQIYFNFDDKGSMTKAFEGYDVVFLLFPMHAKMVEWAQNAISAAQAANVKHIVRSSGAGADINASFFMPHIQGTIDQLIKESGINYTITKPASFMQNFINFFGYDIKNGTVYQPVGNGKIGWVDVRDIAAVNTQVLLHPNDYINQELTITGPENLSYEEALKYISKAIGKEIAFVDIPNEKANETMLNFGLSTFNIDMLSSLNKIIKAGYAEGITNTVLEVTGKAPIPFQQFAIDCQSNWK